jgi:hypothetical protein
MASHRSIYLTEQIKADRGAVPTATTREAQNIANTFFDGKWQVLCLCNKKVNTHIVQNNTKSAAADSKQRKKNRNKYKGLASCRSNDRPTSSWNKRQGDCISQPVQLNFSADPGPNAKKNHEYLVKLLFCCAEFTVCGFCCVLAAGERHDEKDTPSVFFTYGRLV